MTPGSDLALLHRKAVAILTSNDSHFYPQGLAFGRDALRGYLRQALKEAPATNSLMELAESLEEQIPAFSISKELHAQGKTFTVIEAFELFESLELRTDAKTLKDLLGILVRELTRR